MESFSLLYPKDIHYKSNKLTAEALNDLSIDYLTDSLTHDPLEKNIIKNILSEITDTKEVIEYRSDVFEDFYKFSELRAGLIGLVGKLGDLKELERFKKDEEASYLWQLINRLREIDEYIDCITNMKTVLERLDIRSSGMLTLKKILTDICTDSGFEELKADIADAYKMIGKVKSITIGVNLDSLLRPKNAGIVSLNDKEYTDSGLLKRFIKFTKSKDDDISSNISDPSENLKFHSSNGAVTGVVTGTYQTDAYRNVHIETSKITGADPISDALKKPVTEIMRRTVTDLKGMLRKYINVSGYALTNLMSEIVFYIRFAELCDKLTSAGLTLCKATITESNDNRCSIKGLYNLKLGIKVTNGDKIDIVTNDFDFGADHGVYILTGPNRGGKTTFTQAVGLIMLIAQHGIYIPAESAVLSPVDNIFTHFPADENDTVDLGRLGEESKRLSEIFSVATSKSLLLLNESLATTNVSEGLFIARDVLKAMCYLGTRAIFNTHMHDLARELDTINNSEISRSKAVSITTGVSEGKRSFKVSISDPQGISYAKDIAKTYGVTFDQMKKSIDSHRN